MTLSELEKALRIDKHDLDEEWVRQPQLHSEISDEHELATMHRDEKKNEIGVVNAELDESFRAAAAQREEKLTETGIANKILNVPRMKKLKQELLDLNYQVGRLAGLRESFRMRNDALKGLTALHGQNYFTSESGGKPQGDARDRIADQVRSQVQRVRRKARVDE